MIAPRIAVRIQTAPFDAAAEAAAITAGHADVGAVVTFTGLVRLDDGLIALTLECYAEMAEAEITRLVEDAGARWPLQGVTVIHRFGRLAPGEAIVLVVTAAAHRQAAFAAAEFLMDHLKARAPFWKQEERATGLRWVEARTADEDALARWHTGHGAPDAKGPEG